MSEQVYGRHGLG